MSCNKNSRGVVLVVVLVLFMAISGLSVLTIDLSSRGAVDGSLLKSEYEAHFMAEEAIYKFMDRFEKDKTPYSDTPQELWAKPYGDQGFKVTVSVCNAKVNLNDLIVKRNKTEWKTVIPKLFPAGTKYKILMSSLGIWTGRSNSRTQKKIDEFFYGMKFPSYKMPRKLLTTPEEALLINGWDKVGRKWINNNFTVWGKNKININFASPDIILKFVPKLSPYMKKIIFWRNSRGFKDVSQLLTAIKIDADSDIYRDFIKFFGVVSQYFEVTVTAKASGCTVVKRYILSRPNAIKGGGPRLLYQNDVAVTFDGNR